MKLKADFQCVLPGEIYPVTIAAGEECPEVFEDIAADLGLIDLDAGKAEVDANAAAEEEAAAKAEADRVAKEAAMKAVAHEQQAMSEEEAAAKAVADAEPAKKAKG